MAENPHSEEEPVLVDEVDELLSEPEEDDSDFDAVEALDDE